MSCLKIKWFLIISLIGFNVGLISCTNTAKTASETHTEVVYEGGFGGDGGHVHRN